LLYIQETILYAKEKCNFTVNKQIQRVFVTSLTVHSSVLNGNWCAAYREAHMNFSNKSACLMADNVWNEGK
jgi:hypothetical protein